MHLKCEDEYIIETARWTDEGTYDALFSVFKLHNTPVATDNRMPHCRHLEEHYILRQ